MGIIKRLTSFAAAFVIAAAVALSPLTVCADDSIAVTEGNAEASVVVPSGFNIFTSDDIDKPGEFYKNLPITKNEAISLVSSGVMLDAFSKDKKREIRFSIFDSANIGKYAPTVASNTAKSTASSSDSSKTADLAKGINNFSAMKALDRETVIKSFSDELLAKGHTLLSTASEVKISGYYFMKIYARIGGSTTGYTYTSVLTVIGGKCYELTCYNNSPMLSQEEIDENDKVINSLKLALKGNNGELAGNRIQSVVTFIVTLLGIALIVGVIVSLIRPAVNSRNDDTIKLNTPHQPRKSRNSGGVNRSNRTRK